MRHSMLEFLFRRFRRGPLSDLCPAPVDQFLPVCREKFVHHERLQSRHLRPSCEEHSDIDFELPLDHADPASEARQGDQHYRAQSE